MMTLKYLAMAKKNIIGGRWRDPTNSQYFFIGGHWCHWHCWCLGTSHPSLVSVRGPIPSHQLMGLTLTRQD
jgi:hypothetical protein